MQKKNIYLLFLFLISVILRFWKLGEIPQGLSIEEVNWGLSLSSVLGKGILNPFIVRLPFSVVGVGSIFLFYKVTKLISEDFRLAYIASLILSFSPWHIEQSRIYSLALLVFTIGLAVVALLHRKLKSFVRLGKLALGLAGALFLASVMLIGQDLRVKVDQQRNIVAKAKLNFLARPLSNKLVESYRYREKLVFENLDIGNYIFNGHPRERWGVEETQKLYLAVLPLFLLGVVRLRKELGWLLVAWGSLALILPSFFGARGPSSTLPLIFPIILLAAIGVVYLLKKNKAGRWVLYFLTLLFVFEFLVFAKSYFSGLSEGPFSPRRPIYHELIPALKSHVKPKERVLVSQRLGNPSSFFSFYLGAGSLENFEFRTFDVWEETDLDKLFVDVLPKDPSPSEPLYTKNGDWPNELDVLEEFYDENLRYQIVVYRFK